MLEQLLEVGAGRRLGLDLLEEQFGLDKTTLVAYGQWLGIVPREVRISKGDYGVRTDEMIGGDLDAEKIAPVVLRGDGRMVHVTRSGDEIVSAVFADTGKPVATEKWKVRYESEAARQERYLRRNAGVGEKGGVGLMAA